MRSLILIVYHPKRKRQMKEPCVSGNAEAYRGIPGNNPWDALKISVVDTVNSASDLGKAASEELLDIYDSKNISNYI